MHFWLIASVIWGGALLALAVLIVNAGRWVERSGLTINAKTEDLMASWFMYERACPFVRNANAYIRIMFNT